jgi:hypothetical protein
MLQQRRKEFQQTFHAFCPFNNHFRPTGYVDDMSDFTNVWSGRAIRQIFFSCWVFSFMVSSVSPSSSGGILSQGLIFNFIFLTTYVLFIDSPSLLGLQSCVCFKGFLWSRFIMCFIFCSHDPYQMDSKIIELLCKLLYVDPGAYISILAGGV